MEAEIIRIGNSKGIRLPAYIIRECKIKDKVQMEVKDGKIILIPVTQPRKEWGKNFMDMRRNNDDTMLIEDELDEGLEEWEW